MEAGAGLVVDDAAYPRYSMSILTFSAQTLEKRPGDVRRFLKAWDLAAADINAAPEAHRELLLQKIRVPKNVQQIFKIPAYPRKEVPEPGQWADVMDWMVSKGLLNQALPYEDSITTDFLTLKIFQQHVAMIEIKNLTYAYSGSQPIFETFDWQVQQGDAWTVIGPSGCGKTTLLYLMAGLYHPNCGSIHIEESEIISPRPRN
jgi:ATPase subunit of ABC transporter with duplicated ATPase domains